jgi:hypothetical protein
MFGVLVPAGMGAVVLAGVFFGVGTGERLRRGLQALTRGSVLRIIVHTLITLAHCN